MMKNRVAKLLLLAITSLCAWSSTAASLNFPDRPVKVIMPFPPGTGPDTVMRQVGEKLSAKWGHPVVIENRAGGNSWIAVDAVKRVPPDGYTLLLVNSPPVSLHPHLYKKLTFDPVADFDPVASVYRTYFLVTTSINAPWNSLQELIAASKEKPGHLTFGTSGYGSDMHLGASMLQNVADVNWNHIPYKETAQIYMDISRREVDWAFGSLSTTAPLYSAKKLKYLAIAAPRRDKQVPEVPTLREILGDAGFDLQTSVMLLAPRGMPQDVIQRINNDVREVLSLPDIRKNLDNVGFEPLIQTPAELAASNKRESAQYADIVRRMKISLD